VPLASPGSTAGDSGFFAQLGTGLVIAIIAAIVLALAGWFGRHWIKPHIEGFLERLRMRWRAPTIWTFLMLSLDYAVHQRDVMELFWRTRDDPPERIRERIRRDVMEPIRDVLPTRPGERLKIVWFRPTKDGKELQMYEQIGHSPEGQAAMRLPVGIGAAGLAYDSGDTVFVADISADPRYQRIERGQTEGSALCAPIKRGSHVTGVLSVLSNRQNAFWITERRYVEALARAIGALEILEEGADSRTEQVHPGH
jgi:GAF domain-containing protein